MPCKNNEPPMIPRAIVTDIGLKQRVNVWQFIVPECEMAYEPLPVGPDVVVFGVNLEHTGKEGNFSSRQICNVAHYDLSMMPERGERISWDWAVELETGKAPYLEVLDVLDGDGIKPFELFEKVFVQSEEDVCSVKPTKLMSTSIKLEASWTLPDCVMRRVHSNDFFGQLQYSVRFFVLGHDGSEVRHGFAVFICVGDGGQRIGAPIVLGNWNNVVPDLGV